MLTDIAHRIRGRTLSEVLRHLESVARLQGLLRRAQSSTHHGPHISPYSFFLTRLMTSLCTDTLSQSALFNFQSLLLVILLLICTCTYVRAVAPRLIDSNKQGYVFSALLRRGSVSSLTFPRMTRTVFWQIFRIHVPTRLSCFPVLTATCTVLDSLVFFSCLRELVSFIIPHIPQLGADRPNPMFAPCAGERLSPYVALACIAMAVRMILS